MNIKKDYLVPNPYSRPQTSLKDITKVVVHYVANPGSSAQNNRDYFNNQPSFPADQRRYVSAHYVIGLEGEIIQCIPEEEIAYCSNSANAYSISIECCHPDASGQFLAVTEEALASLLADICKRYNLNPQTDIIRHYDVTGKACPLWYVSHPEDFEALRLRVQKKIAGEDIEQSTEQKLYRVQLGAFNYRKNAESLILKLRSDGYKDAFIKEA